jgi:hypothetical protein
MIRTLLRQQWMVAWMRWVLLLVHKVWKRWLHQTQREKILLLEWIWPLAQRELLQEGIRWTVPWGQQWMRMKSVVDRLLTRLYQMLGPQLMQV